MLTIEYLLLYNCILMKEDKDKFLLSRTAEFNTRFIHDGGVFEIDKPGKYRIFLTRSTDGDDMRIESIDFVKIK